MLEALTYTTYATGLERVEAIRLACNRNVTLSAMNSKLKQLHNTKSWRWKKPYNEMKLLTDWSYLEIKSLRMFSRDTSDIDYPELAERMTKVAADFQAAYPPEIVREPHEFTDDEIELALIYLDWDLPDAFQVVGTYGKEYDDAFSILILQYLNNSMAYRATQQEMRSQNDTLVALAMKKLERSIDERVQKDLSLPDDRSLLKRSGLNREIFKRFGVSFGSDQSAPSLPATSISQPSVAPAPSATPQAKSRPWEL